MLRDDMGVGADLAQRPRRVVSLVPSLTESIAATAPELLAGVTQWCTHPEGLDVARVRGTKNPDREAIVRLRPDLVLANREENRELDVRRLREAGLQVWVTVIETVAEAFDSLDRLFTQALQLGQPPWLAQARQAWDEPAPSHGTNVAIPIWRDPWMVVGSRTFTGDLVARLGARNAFAESADRYPKVELSGIDREGIDLVVMPDEPYPFNASDGPEAFSTVPARLVSGRLLTWYGPSLLTARQDLPPLLTA